MHITMTNSKHRRTKRIALRLAQYAAVITAGTLVGLAVAELAPSTSAPRPVATQETTACVGDLACEDTSDEACWFEKAGTLDTAELICGVRGLMPTGAVDWYAMVRSDVPDSVWRYAVEHGAPSGVDRDADGQAVEYLAVPVGTVLGPVGQVWVATYDGMEPVPSV